MNLLSILLQAAPQGGGMMSSLIMMALIFVVFYFFMIRPQQKKQKQIKIFRDNLGVGDLVVTIGGIHGKIVGVEEDSVMLEIAPNVKIKVDKNGISEAGAIKKEN